MAALFNTYLYQPILDLLVFIYQNFAFNDLGLAIIFLTVLIRIVFLPFFHKSTRDQMIMQRLQPQINKIRHDHKNDKEKQATALLALYRQHRVNPLSGFLLLLIQLPILFALFRVFRDGLTAEAFSAHSFLGLINLENRSMIIVGLAALAQYWQSRQAMGKRAAPAKNSRAEDGTAAQFSQSFAQNMVYMGPIITVAILSMLPASIGIYWLTTTLFSIGQQFYINKRLTTGENEKTKTTLV